MKAGTAQPGAGFARALLLLLLLYFALAGLLRPLLRPYVYSDFVTFYSAAEAFAERRSPYALDSLRRADTAFEGWVGRYFYPPPFAAVIMRPFLLLPFDLARRLWVLVEAAAYLSAAVVLGKLAFGTLRLPHWAALGLLFLPFAPFHLDLKLGSVSGVLLLLLTLFLRAYQRGHAWRAAGALAAAILLKVAPAFLLAYLFLRGERRLVGRTLTMLAAYVVATLPWSGTTAYTEYVTRVIPYLATANFSWFTNQSIDAVFWRLFMPNPDTTPWVESALLYRLGTLLLGAAIVVALVRVARRRKGMQRDAWGLGLALVASLLLARVTWEYMVVLTLPSFVLWLRAAWNGEVKQPLLWGAGIAYALCALPFPYASDPLRSGVGLLLEAPRFCGMLLAFGVGCGSQNVSGASGCGAPRQSSEPI
ncbi:MAG: DUF2029 domain-containing protein [Candidatus Latescibacterota bacterium]|nr:MAG: DUF2029 domain-containing protein [Candidatus Latescibacterota bacterium]